MSQRGSRKPPEPESFIDRIDWVLVSRGSWIGFFILVISGLINPMVGQVNPVAGLVQLGLGAVIGAAVAAWRTREAAYPVHTGAAAALIAYTLVIPLIYMVQRRLDISVLVTAVVALAVGALTGLIVARRRQA